MKWATTGGRPRPPGSPSIIAGRKLGWLVLFHVPTNIGTVAGGGLGVGRPGISALGSAVLDQSHAQRLPRDQDLDDCRLPNGVSIKVLEPCTRYKLGYDDDPRFTADLLYAGVMPPEPLTAVGSTFGSAHHYDQFGRVTGEIVLHVSASRSTA